MPKVVCINKMDRFDPYERITHIGYIDALGVWRRISQREAILWLNNPAAERFWIERGGARVYLIVKRSRFGNDYVTTEADGESQNNLLMLPQCA